jgi:hypothetical protein
VLFIGNSLTYVNDLPGTLSVLALSTGDTVRVAEVTEPDYALVDHVVAGRAVPVIKAGGWQFVVLQQGPSSVQINRDSLIMMTRYFDPFIRAIGATAALYSVWPQVVYYNTFDRAIESYRLAAQAVGGLYLPVGAAWQAALAGDPELALYSPDGLHPTELGTYLAALVMYERFTGKDARQLSGQALVSRRPMPEVPESRVRFLQRMAHEANQKAAAR